jgi:hypothetical protein
MVEDIIAVTLILDTAPPPPPYKSHSSRGDSLAS